MIAYYVAGVFWLTISSIVYLLYISSNDIWYIDSDQPFILHLVCLPASIIAGVSAAIILMFASMFNEG